VVKTGLFVLCLKANEQLVLWGKKIECSGTVGFTEFFINLRNRGNAGFAVGLWFEISTQASDKL